MASGIEPLSRPLPAAPARGAAGRVLGPRGPGLRRAGRGRRSAEWQARQVEAGLRRGLATPVALQGVPMTLGPWRGRPEALDPQIARLSGQTDHIFRSYVDTRTGVALDVIVLYGPAVALKEHAPEQCYPAAGFAVVEGPDLREIPTAGGPVPFHALLVAKGQGAEAERQEVYYTWRCGGRWTPLRGTHKQLERIPGMYKVHLARRVAAGELRDVGNPCQEFLKDLIPALDRLLAGAGPGRAGGPPSLATAPTP